MKSVHTPVVVNELRGNPLKTEPKAQTIDNKRMDQEVLFRCTPDALLGGLIFEKIDLFEAQEVKSAFESGFSG